MPLDWNGSAAAPAPTFRHCDRAEHWGIVGTSIALLLTVLTNHEASLIKVLPYSFHVLVDRLVGVTFVIAPFALDFTGLDAIYYWANAATVLAATFVFNAPLEMKAA